MFLISFGVNCPFNLGIESDLLLLHSYNSLFPQTYILTNSNGLYINQIRKLLVVFDPSLLPLIYPDATNTNTGLKNINQYDIADVTLI